jgi:hypothetical protein
MGCDIWDSARRGARDLTGRARTLGVLYRLARDLRNHALTWLE